MASQEYNKFGPWVYEVENLGELPRVFKPYYKEGEDYFLLIKIPRDVERRLVKDGMDLYDYVVAIYFDFVYILRRTQYGVEVIYIYYKDLCSMKISKHLLKGQLDFYITSGVISLPFNVVSYELIYHMIELIRMRYAYDAYDDINQLESVDYKYIIDNLLTTITSKMFDNENDARVIAVQPTVPANMRPTSMLSDIWNTFSQYKLQNTLYIANRRELMILNRGQQIRGAREAVHSFEATYIPFEKITSFSTAQSNEFENLSVLKLNCSGVEVENLYQTSNHFIKRFKDVLPEIISNFEWKRNYYDQK